jgi:hypothetical protein
MECQWNTGSHPISDLRDWSVNKRLEVRPDYQRNAVWSDVSKIMLIDTILKNIPIPKIYLDAQIKDQNTYRIVIDGQQRILAILDYLNDEFGLNEPYEGKFKDLKFSDLDEVTQNKFLSYKLDMNEIINASEVTIREIYHRVNRYTIPLNKQEMRRADYPGKFLNLAEELAGEGYFEENRIFTLVASKRMGDVEFISELLVMLLSGIQDKQKELDNYYLKYSKWDESEMNGIKERFLKVIIELELIFDPQIFNISKTRFRQKADFYSLFSVIDNCITECGSLSENNFDLSYLREDLEFLNMSIKPETDIKILSEYAIKCLSQGNTIASRNWRKNFLYQFLQGAYSSKVPSDSGLDIFANIISNNIYGICPAETNCAFCGKIVSDEDLYLSWGKAENTFQLSNAIVIHDDCRNKANVDFIITKKKL